MAVQEPLLAQDGIVRGLSFIFMPSLVFYCFGNVFHQQYLSNTHDENPVVYLPAYLSICTFIHTLHSNQIKRSFISSP